MNHNTQAIDHDPVPATDLPKAISRASEKRDQETNQLSAKDRYFSLKSHNTRVEIPQSVFDQIHLLGRGKYRAIITLAAMSLLWDGWRNKRSKKTKRVPKEDVLYTRRMAANWFDIPAATTARALKDLISMGLISVHEKGRFSSRQGKRLGTTYKLTWLPSPKGEHRIWLHWALFISKPFQELSETAQAILILLHTFHHRRSNRLSVKSRMLEQYGVHRNVFSVSLKEILKSGLLEYVGDSEYRFAWLTRGGCIDSGWAINHSSE